MHVDLHLPFVLRLLPLPRTVKGLFSAGAVAQVVDLGVEPLPIMQEVERRLTVQRAGRTFSLGRLA
jgi:hypothetical protein